MKHHLYYFAWKEAIRSASVNKNMATKGVLIFFAVYFFFVALLLGLNLSEHLSESFPGQSQISVFNSLILIYAGADLVARILVQSLPVFGFRHFLLIPVKRKKIAEFMLSKSLLHFFNVLPLFLIIPFTFKTAIVELSGIQFFLWVTSLVLMIPVNHFLAIYIKWRTNESAFFLYIFLVLAASLYLIDYFGILDLTSAFGGFFDLVIGSPPLILVFPVVITLLYLLNFNYLLSRFYVDEFEIKKKSRGRIYDFSWLNRFSEYGHMLSLEVKMIIRNKRPRSSAMMSIIFLFYGLLLYRPANGEISESVLVFGGMFLTGVFSMTYGQFFPAWHSRYYSLLMAQNIKMKQILQSAFFLMAFTNVLFYLLSLGYMYLSPKVWYIHLAVMLYNVGVNSFVIFALGLTSRKSIDLEQRAMFNYQGMGASQWLITFPILLGPMAVYGICLLLFGKIAAYVILGGLGVLGIILHPVLIDKFSSAYLKRKHAMVSAYKVT